MKFYIESVNFYRPEPLINRYPCLHNYGFKIAHIAIAARGGKTVVTDRAMITIDSLEQLAQLHDDLNMPLTVNYARDGIENLVIMICDEDRE